MESKLLSLFKKIKLIVFDFDGVFTDNFVYVNEKGEEMVRCCRADGIGLKRIQDLNIKMIVLSQEVNPVVIKRCEKLKLPCLTGHEKKLSVLKKIIEDNSLKPDEVCYVGNDLPDVPCMEIVGLPITVSDAIEETKKVAKQITDRKSVV